MKNKILFILDGPTPNSGAGSILVDKIMKTYGFHNLSILGLRNNVKNGEFTSEYNKVDFKTFAIRLPKSNIFFKLVKRLPLVETIYILFRVWLTHGKIIKHAKNQKCDAIFTILRGDSLLIINKVIKALNVPVIGFDTDTVESEFIDHKLIYWIKKRNYYKVIYEISSMATIGETMQTLYKSNFNVDSLILRMSFKKPKENKLKIINDEINIIFLGNIYAQPELQIFISAMDIYLAKTKKFRVNFFVATHNPIVLKTEYLKIINIGWVTEEILVTYIDKSHIAYLPYKFDIKYESQMKYAFPTKSGLYITHELPIYFHGPKYSSFNTFLKKYKVGVSCDSVNYEKIISTFETLIEDKKLYNDFQSECIRAYHNEFSEYIFSKKINDLFDLSLKPNLMNATD